MYYKHTTLYIHMLLLLSIKYVTINSAITFNNNVKLQTRFATSKITTFIVNKTYMTVGIKSFYCKFLFHGNV